MSERLDDEMDRLDRLAAEADAKRAHFTDLLDATRKEASPSNLIKNASDRVLDKGLDAIGEARSALLAYPLRTAGIVAALVAFMARRPLLSWTAMGYAALRERLNSGIATAADPESSTVPDSDQKD